MLCSRCNHAYPSASFPFPDTSAASRTLPPQSRSAVSPMHFVRSLSPARRPATATLLLPFHYHSKTEPPPLLPPPPRRTLSASPPLDRRRQQQGPSLLLPLSLSPLLAAPHNSGTGSRAAAAAAAARSLINLGMEGANARQPAAQTIPGSVAGFIHHSLH